MTLRTRTRSRLLKIRALFASGTTWAVIHAFITWLGFLLTLGAGIYIALTGEWHRALLLALFAVILLVANHLGDADQ